MAELVYEIRTRELLKSKVNLSIYTNILIIYDLCLILQVVKKSGKENDPPASSKETAPKPRSSDVRRSSRLSLKKNRQMSNEEMSTPMEIGSPIMKVPENKRTSKVRDTSGLQITSIRY